MSLVPVMKKDDPDEQNGGDHCSLMVIDTRSRTFAHLDPIEGFNERCAKDLFVNIMTREFIDDDGCLPKYVENNDCKRQKNGYDCGPFVINYIWSILEFAKAGMDYFVKRATNQIDEKNIRRTLRNTLISEIKKAEEKTVKKSDEEMEIVVIPIEENVAGKREKEVETEKEADKQKKEEEIEMLENIVKDIKKKGGPWEGIQQSIEELKNETKNNSPHSTAQNVNGTRNNDNEGNGQANSKNKKEILCKNFIHRVCNFGNYCRYTHPDICKEWEDNGRCEGVNGTCKMPHPQICITHIKQETCRWRDCRYVHPRNTQQRHVPKQLGHEYRDNMDRKGNPRHTNPVQTRDQNGYNQSHRQKFLRTRRDWNQPRHRPTMMTEMRQEMGNVEHRLDMKLEKIMEKMEKMEKQNQPNY